MVPVLPIELPAELVVLPLALVVTAAVAYRARLRPIPVILGRVLLVAYGAALVATTLFPLPITPSPADLDAVASAVNLVPLVGADPAGIVLNVVLFVPLGLLLPWVRSRSRAATVAGTAFLVSLAIELTQLAQTAFLSGGRAFDVDDLIANTAGAVVGYVLFRTAVRSMRETRPTAASAQSVPAGQTGFSSRAQAEP